MSSSHERALADAAHLLARRVGLRIDPNARGRLTRCVSEAAQSRGIDVGDYIKCLETDPGALQDLLNRVTVQETSFFRDPAQFDALARQVLPTFPDPVTIWSAGCANGQEAYSAAMVLDELGYRESRVIATDVSTQALARTREARYSQSEIKGLSHVRRDQYLEASDKRYEVVPELRGRVDVAHHNLVTDAPPFAPFSCPIVFCRNVLIYFSPDEVVRFLDRLAQWMSPGGWLFLGYSETLWQVTDGFELVRTGDAFVYRRGEPRSEGPAGSKRSERAAPRSAPAAPRTQRTRRPGPVARATRSAIHDEGVDSESGISELLAAGEAAVQAGDHAGAIAAFRKCTYLEPDHVVAQVQLGLTLEISGDLQAASRAYAAARATLDRCDTAMVEATLEGYHPDELVRFLDDKAPIAR